VSTTVSCVSCTQYYHTHIMLKAITFPITSTFRYVLLLVVVVVCLPTTTALLSPVACDPIINTNTRSIRTKTTTISQFSLCNYSEQPCRQHPHDHLTSCYRRSPSMVTQHMSSGSNDFSDISGLDSGVIMPEDGLGSPCVIKVIGVGGGGGNAVNRMIETKIEGVSFWALNTDVQALKESLSPNRLNIGREVTRGLGAGGKPEVGKEAALENADDIRQICTGADMVFVTAGMGGGTGSGAAPVVAGIAKEDCGCLTVGIVTRPFNFEGRKRNKQSEEAIAELRKNVDTLVVVSNDRLLRIVPDNTPVQQAFMVADDILRQGVVGIAEIIIKTGLVNVDFADVRAVIKDAGTALMGVGTGSGKTRAADAAIAAISSPLLDFPISKAKRMVINCVGGLDMGLAEINAASEVVKENAHEDANIIFGALIDEKMGDDVSITVLACDFREDDGSTAKEQRVENLKMVGGRDPNFYKERRLATKSPLGPDATLEDTHIAITRGFKKPTPDPEPEVEGKKTKRSLIRRMLGKIIRKDPR